MADMIPNFIQENAEVLANEPVAQNVYLMRLQAPRIAQACKPAQFVQIQTDPGLAPFLRRPFSTLRVDTKAGWMEILYDTIGTGTRRLAATNPGDQLNLLGPLGLPFSPPNTERLLLVAGGVGVVPLAFLAWHNPSLRPRTIFLMGAAGKHRMPNMDRLVPEDLERHLATDDGSLGHKGFVTDLIAQHTIPNQTVVFTCGPHPMMARVAALAAESNLPCYASLENHMACGFGACVGCVVEYREAEREDRKYRKVCTEGPVVDAHAIVW
ncbi:MAG: dihydroorotate dehydrogenase electron transfer subunit [bacterium]|nr:dihydroorotate dehydrogenase electron transfer subunit [bacterium]